MYLALIDFAPNASLTTPLSKLEELCYEMERYSSNVLGISKARWLSSGEVTSENGHRFWYSGEEDFILMASVT